MTIQLLSIVGPDQGTCGCDQRCTCQPEWTGPACDCTLSTAQCVNPFGVSIGTLGQSLVFPILPFSQKHAGKYFVLLYAFQLMWSANNTLFSLL